MPFVLTETKNNLDAVKENKKHKHKKWTGALNGLMALAIQRSIHYTASLVFSMRFLKPINAPRALRCSSQYLNGRL
jgi:hypothetical protein